MTTTGLTPVNGTKDLTKVYDLVEKLGRKNFEIFVDPMVYKSSHAPKNRYHLSDSAVPDTALGILELGLQVAAINAAKAFIDSGLFEDENVKPVPVALSELARLEAPEEPVEELETETEVEVALEDKRSLEGKGRSRKPKTVELSTLEKTSKPGTDEADEAGNEKPDQTLP